MLRRSISPLVKGDSSILRQNIAELEALPDLPAQTSTHVKVDRCRIIETLTSPFVSNIQSKPEIEVGRRCFRQDLHAKYVGFSYTSPGSTSLLSPLHIDVSRVDVEEESHRVSRVDVEEESLFPAELGSNVLNQFSFSEASSTLR